MRHLLLLAIPLPLPRFHRKHLEWIPDVGMDANRRTDVMNSDFLSNTKKVSDSEEEEIMCVKTKKQRKDGLIIKEHIINNFFMRKLVAILLCMFGCVIVVMLSGCKDSFLIECREYDIEQVNSHFVSLEDALDKAESILSEFYGKTRTVRMVDNVELLNNSTRSCDESELSALFYIVNYSGNAGFAVLSSDNRLNPIFAHSDEGSLHLADTIENKGLSWYLNDCLSSQTLSNIYDNTFPLDTIPASDPTQVITFEQDICPPLLKGLLRKMHQTNPYNKYCPSVNNKRALTGCVPLAVGTVMAYHKWPASISGYSFEWIQMLSTEWHDKWARLFEVLGRADYLNANYRDPDTFGTTAYFEDIVDVMNKCGYSNTKYSSFSQYLLEKDLKEGVPVFVDGAQKNGNTRHVWLIDGAYRLIKNIPTHPDGYRTQTYTYYHCVWGYRQQAVGYFLFHDGYSAVQGGSPSQPDDDAYGSVPYFGDLKIIYNYRSNK